MASFATADLIRAKHEGGYQHDPDDKGNTATMGTYAGVAPAFWPQWGGWRVVKRHLDRMVKMPKWGTAECDRWTQYLNKCLAEDPLLQNYVREFYKAQFWDAHRLSEVDNQAVANWIYDHAVNAGARGIMWAQEAAGVEADGKVGPITLAAINAANPAALLARMKSTAVEHRMKRVESHPEEKKFLRTWLSRDGLSDREIKEVLATV